MSTIMMNGFGFSRFMVESFAHAGGVKQGSDADGSVSTTATTTPASSSRQESAADPAKSALSPDAFSRRSTAETDPDDDTEPLVPLSVQVAYDRVARVSFQASSRIDWHQLRSSTSLWEEKKKLSATSSFTIYTRQTRGMHYVMALGTLSCTLAELESILRPTTAAAYRTAMAELYSDAFVDGAIRYRSSASSSSRSAARPRAASTRHRSRSGRAGAATTPSGMTSSRPSLYSGSLYSSTPAVSTASSSPAPVLNYVVKTATFARAHVFAKAQQWTFLECFQPTADGFMVTLSSLSPTREAAVPTKRERTATLTGTPGSGSSAVEHLQGVTAAYSVAVVPSSSPSRRSELLVTFYSKFADDSTTFGPLKRHAFKLTLRAHLLTMARAATRLPMIVRRKRLDALALTSAKAFSAATNAACICCTATLHFLRAKTRCYACGYFVCDRCSLEQEVSADAAVDRTRVCQLCIRRVDHAVYNNRGELAEALDAPLPSRPTTTTSTRGFTTPSRANALDELFHTVPERKRTVLTTYVQSDDCDLHATIKVPQTRLRSSSLSSLASSLLSPPSSVDLEAFTSPRDRGLRLQNESVLLPGCDDSVWVDYEDDGDFTGNSSSSSTRALQSPLTCPVPQNDAHRSKMAQQQLAQLEDVSSLEIICSIASQELSCPVAMVTLVASTKTHVVATNCAPYRHAVVPRGESLCAYTIMCDDAEDREVAAREPLVVAQPALDARFCDLAIVQQRGLQFYCGFPLTSEDGSVVGALCCGDFASTSGGATTGGATTGGARPALTPQQTDAMVKLAATASRVMQLRGKDAYKRL